ncbi:MAG: glycosyltransferase [Candidatus Woesearchaeota archaeon]
MDLSIILPTYNEESNIKDLIIQVKTILKNIKMSYEIIVIDANSKDNTQKNARELGAKVIIQKNPGYGSALKEGFEIAQGDYILTMDSDLSHDPKWITTLWKNRESADILIASRFVRGGKTDTSLFRKILSLILNNTFAIALSTPFKDLSIGYRLYKKNVIQEIKIIGHDFNVLQEILIRSYSSGFIIKEIPVHVKKRKEGKSKLQLFKFGISYLKSLFRLWKLRTSIESADYDSRAYYSKIPLQRYWHRKRYKIIMKFLNHEKNILDIGCGTSKIIQNLPTATALDLRFNRLRFLKKTNRYLINGDVNNLPFKDKSYKVIIFSNVLEHLENDQKALKEINRVLKNNSILILNTPDYGTLMWRIIEFFYTKIISQGGHCHEHKNKYTYKKLRDRLLKDGFKIIDHKYIFGSELAVKCIKI